ncbi:uncharacterized protein LOC114955932 [Acropora millepora]|uniref:uncharacterized protein LOC114955932 n=1 Tax=Acropora millepora TaxID=45264 RepID=UPI001CF41F5C|nr:uncharacterized protein LOC114955932 [Acropora millepora]
MLKLGYQFVLVFLFARQCYLSPLNWNELGEKAAETIIDSLLHNALKSAMGDESSRGLGKIQQQGPSGEKETLRLNQDQERRDEVLMSRSCGQIKYSAISHICCGGFVHRKSGLGRTACCGSHTFNSQTQVCKRGVVHTKIEPRNNSSLAS